MICWRISKGRSKKCEKKVGALAEGSAAMAVISTSNMPRKVPKTILIPVKEIHLPGLPSLKVKERRKVSSSAERMRASRTRPVTASMARGKLSSG